MAYAQTETIPRERADGTSRTASSPRLAKRVAAYCTFAVSFGFASAVVLGFIP